MWNAGMDESQTGMNIAGRKIYNLRYADDTTLMVESEEEWKSLLIRVKEESETWNWLETQYGEKKNKDHGIWSHHFMVNRWGKSENGDRFSFLGLPNHCGQWLQP